MYTVSIVSLTKPNVQDILVTVDSRILVTNKLLYCIILPKEMFMPGYLENIYKLLQK